MAQMTRRLCAVLFLALALGGCNGDAAGGEFAIPPDAQKTASGLSWKMLKAGTGTARPTPTSTVLVHYTGWKMDGEKVDSSVDRGQPIDFRLDGVIDGWTEGLQLMVVGEKRRFWIPGHLAYDNSSRPGAPKGMLVFDIELLEFK